MQELKMPLTQIEEIFTKSELAIMAWTSQEQSASIEETAKKSKRKSVMQRRKSPEELLAEDLTGEEISHEEIEYEQQSRELPARYYNDEGEVDLSKLTGKEAVKYLARQGLHFLPIFKTK